MYQDSVGNLAAHKEEINELKAKVNRRKCYLQLGLVYAKSPIFRGSKAIGQVHIISNRMTVFNT